MNKNIVGTSPLVSVLVPMYNTEKTIERCIKSILSQTYTNLEIVLLNDGSIDKTYEIAKSFADKDKRIKLLTKENEKNLAKTRNFLLNSFSGDYVVWVDSDDVLHEKYVEKLYNTIITTNADLGICGFELQFANLPLPKNRFSKVRIFENNDMYSQVILNHKVGFSLWNKIYKKELIKGLSFKDEVSFGEDFAFVYKYLKRCKKIAYLNEKLYKYIVHKGSETTKKFSTKKVSFVDYLENLLIEENNPFIKNIIKSWLAFSGNSMLFLAKKSKFDDVAVLTKLYDVAQRYKSEFFKNKDVKFLHKFVARIGYITWARKVPKEKLKKI